MATLSPTLEETYSDLLSRFFANLPLSELTNPERVAFSLQEAHWFYLDFYSDKYTHLPDLEMGAFAKGLFAHARKVHGFSNLQSTSASQFYKYLKAIPCCGGILLSSRMDQCVLVCGWIGNHWTFPKGKIDRGESEVDCAVREIHEECGFDVSGLIDKDAFVDVNSKGRQTRLFVITGVDPATAVFRTRTRKEISDIKWFPLTKLPSQPVVSALQQWIQSRPGFTGPQPKLARPDSKTRGPARSQSNSNTREAHGHPQPHAHAHAHAHARSGMGGGGPVEYRDHRTHRDWDQKLMETFGDAARGASPESKQQRQKGLGVGGGSGSAGWSAQDMFRANEQLGFKSSMPVSDLVYPPNADEILARVLGPNYKGKESKGARSHAPQQVPVRCNNNSNGGKRKPGVSAPITILKPQHKRSAGPNGHDGFSPPTQGPRAQPQHHPHPHSHSHSLPNMEYVPAAPGGPAHVPVAGGGSAAGEYSLDDLTHMLRASIGITTYPAAPTPALSPQAQESAQIQAAQGPVPTGAADRKRGRRGGRKDKTAAHVTPAHVPAPKPVPVPVAASLNAQLPGDPLLDFRFDSGSILDSLSMALDTHA